MPSIPHIGEPFSGECDDTPGSETPLQSESSTGSVLGRFFGGIGHSRKAIRDVMVSMIPQAVTVTAGFVTSILIARGLGPSGLGRYAIVMSVSGIAVSLSDLGINQTAIRYASMAVAQGTADIQMAVLRWAFRLRLALVLVVTLGLHLATPLLAARVWKSPSLVPMLHIGLIGGFFTALSAIPVVFFQSVKRFGMNAAVSSSQRLLSFGGILLIAWLGLWSVQNAVIVTTITAAIGATAFLLLVPRAAIWPAHGFQAMRSLTLRRFASCPHVSSPVEGDLVQETATQFAKYNLLSTVIVMVKLQVDIWMIGHFLPDSAVGVYSAAMRFTLPLTMVLGAVNTALWPRASHCQTTESVKLLIRRTLRLTLLVFALEVLYSTFAPGLSSLVFGHQYAASASLARLLCWRLCLSLLICPIGIVAYSLGFVRFVWICNLIQLAVIVSMNVLLLPVLGPTASALALMASEIIGVIAVVGFVSIRLRELQNTAQSG